MASEVSSQDISHILNQLFANVSGFSTYGYHSFPSAANFVSIQTHPYFNHPNSLEDNGNNDLASDETDRDTDSRTQPFYIIKYEIYNK